MLRELHLQHLVKGSVGALFAEHTVALLQRLIVAYECVHGKTVILREDHIHPPPSLVAPSANQFRIRRRDHHQRQQSDVVRQPRVRLLVALELLALAAWEGEKDGLGAVAKEVFTL